MVSIESGIYDTGCDITVVTRTVISRLQEKTARWIEHNWTRFDLNGVGGWDNDGGRGGRATERFDPQRHQRRCQNANCPARQHRTLTTQTCAMHLAAPAMTQPRH
ncbi:hypothetical protein NFJ02_17g25930 [Pycnococcus provasolii]